MILKGPLGIARVLEFFADETFIFVKRVVKTVMKLVFIFTFMLTVFAIMLPQLFVYIFIHGCITPKYCEDVPQFSTRKAFYAYIVEISVENTKVVLGPLFGAMSLSGPMLRVLPALEASVGGPGPSWAEKC